MRNKLVVAILFVFSSLVSAEPQLDAKLTVFKAYLGSWESNFDVPKGKPQMRDVSHWERALNGTAIRSLHSINDGMYGGESLIFWDKSKESLVFYYFTTAGFYTQGTMEVLDEGEFVAYEEVVNNDSGITKVKSTSKFENGQFTVSTQYLKNGQWTQPESRVYTRSDKTVKFK
ncbi:hypothetical protein EAG18_02360 [Pseudoalteromonas sp. J010]|uniref:hypothetical protein n=1 Tax=Pseudoalteromonas sp. J010 TaxID=998465 RepID=UPI000F64D3FF|nr:hypothetical protein [Pseudoalteromonas sp. J010]RRS10421.1 hypothetical protein EAG18_02360 [Pseudoalteromonas sp. J010]